jgi:hypothetical protein
MVIVPFLRAANAAAREQEEEQEEEREEEEREEEERRDGGEEEHEEGGGGSRGSRGGGGRGHSVRACTAYVHVVGLGLGVWMLDEAVQMTLMMEEYAHALQHLPLQHISDLDFSWFPDACRECAGVADGGMFYGGPVVTDDAAADDDADAADDAAGDAADDAADDAAAGAGAGAGDTNMPDANRGCNNIRMHFTKRDPAALLLNEEGGEVPEEEETRLLVAMYAWDGNSYPGIVYVWCVCMVCGVWCVCVCGVWWMVCMVYGVRCMVCMVYGVWCMVYGVWCVVCGV